MKITVKPNQNSELTRRYGSRAGIVSYEMVDLVAGESVWGSVHVDFFHGTDFYERVRSGEQVELEVAEAMREGESDG